MRVGARVGLTRMGGEFNGGFLVLFVSKCVRAF